MVRIVRPMKRNPADGLPLVGAQGKCLGARVNCPKPDVELDASGNVVVNRKGMSVSECWRDLPGWLIPEHLDDGFNGASGKGMEVYVHGQGTGSFAEGPVGPGLELCYKPDVTSAGEVCPVASVPLADYQNDLAATRPSWVVDES